MPDSLPAYLAAYDEDAHLPRLARNELTFSQAWEETFFLGLRLNAGVNLINVARQFGVGQVNHAREVIRELTGLQLMEIEAEVVRLTPRGRLVSNEVFQRFVSDAVPR